MKTMIRCTLPSSYLLGRAHTHPVTSPPGCRRNRSLTVTPRTKLYTFTNTSWACRYSVYTTTSPAHSHRLSLRHLEISRTTRHTRVHTHTHTTHSHDVRHSMHMVHVTPQHCSAPSSPPACAPPLPPWLAPRPPPSTPRPPPRAPPRGHAPHPRSPPSPPHTRRTPCRAK